MKNKRLVIETSETSKDALNHILNEQGKTLTDWFNDKVEEEIAPYNIQSTISEGASNQIRHLNDLIDSKIVLNKLLAQDWSFTNDDTSYLSHNIHPYPAKYIPQIPSILIKQLSLPGEVVWDPFGGSGTTALEALLNGRQAISSDINPIAEIVGLGKTTYLNENEEEEIKLFINKILVLAENEDNFQHVLCNHKLEIDHLIPLIPNIEKWFQSNAIYELAYLRWVINTQLSFKVKNLSLSVFSKIIVRVSFQDGETRYVSKPRKVNNLSTLKLFSSELSSTLKKIKQLPSNLKFGHARFVTANLTKENFISENSVDLIVTSPPYPNATDYHLYHRFRIFWLGFDPKSMSQNEIGSHLRHQKGNTEIEQYLKEMSECLQKMFAAIRPGRYAVLVIGDAVYKGTSYDTSKLLEPVAVKIGFEIVGIVPRNVHETKRSFISAARRLRVEKFLIIRKPKKKITFSLDPPAYKLWDYENEMRILF